MYPGSDRVDVGTTVVEVLLSGKYYLTGDLPKEAQKFVEDFDYTGVKGKTKFPMPAPIAFDIDMKPRVY
jgi:hypothetical protein